MAASRRGSATPPPDRPGPSHPSLHMVMALRDAVGATPVSSAGSSPSSLLLSPASGLPPATTATAGATAIKVAVRVRPFTEAEKAQRCKSVIRVSGRSIAITDPLFLVDDSDGDESIRRANERIFTFDHSYSSVDKASPGYASQSTIFADLGDFLLNNAWAGYNCSVFAYGQTGTGKTYTMLGVEGGSAGRPEDMGIVPRLCNELFRSIAERSEDNQGRYALEVSYVEIYNETVRDLFSPRGGALRVREHRKTGAYVEDLQWLAVCSYEEIERLLAIGAQARTVAATDVNNTSSRSHAIFTIVFRQSSVDVDACKTSKISLVDLAGSERTKASGVTGIRMVEATNINKSLSTLGAVISTLSSSGHDNFVPYRNSVLTLLLRESLGGNSKTAMIATVSPADHCYSQSLSTLKYMERAKRIVTTAVVNEGKDVDVVNQLRSEILALRKQLSDHAVVGVALARTEAENEKLREMVKNKEKLIDLLDRSWDQKRAATYRVESLAVVPAAASYVNVPHLVNLCPDPMYSGSSIMPLGIGEHLVGNFEAAKPQVSGNVQLVNLPGANVLNPHCFISSTESGVTVRAAPGAWTMVNGVSLHPEDDNSMESEPRVLADGDRLVIGFEHFFKYRNGSSADASSPVRPSATRVDWAQANQEIFATAIKRHQSMPRFKGSPEGLAHPPLVEFQRATSDGSTTMRSTSPGFSSAVLSDQLLDHSLSLERSQSVVSESDHAAVVQDNAKVRVTAGPGILLTWAAQLRKLVSQLQADRTDELQRLRKQAAKDAAADYRVEIRRLQEELGAMREARQAEYVAAQDLAAETAAVKAALAANMQVVLPRKFVSIKESLEGLRSDVQDWSDGFRWSLDALNKGVRKRWSVAQKERRQDLLFQQQLQDVIHDQEEQLKGQSGESTAEIRRWRRELQISQTAHRAELHLAKEQLAQAQTALQHARDSQLAAIDAAVQAALSRVHMEHEHQLMQAQEQVAARCQALEESRHARFQAERSDLLHEIEELKSMLQLGQRPHSADSLSNGVDAECTQLRLECAEAQEQLAQVTNDLEEVQAGLQAALKKASAAQHELTIVTSERDALRRREQDQAATITSLQQQLESVKAQHDMQCKQLRAELCASQEQTHAALAEKQTIQIAFVDLQAEAEAAEEQLRGMQHQQSQDAQARDQQVAEAEQRAEAAMQDVSRLQAALAKLQAAEATSTQQFAASAAEVGHLRSQLDTATAQIVHLQAQLETVQTGSSQQAAELQTLESHLSACKQQMEEQSTAAAAELVELRTQRDAANSAQAADSQTLLAACKQQMEEQAAAAAAELVELRTQLETAHAANSAQAADSQALQSQLAACKQQLQEQAAAAAAQLADLQTQLETAHAANSVQAADSQSQEAQLAACKQQLEEQAAAAAAQLAELRTQVQIAQAASSAQAADSQALQSQLVACKQQMEEQAAAAAAQLVDLQTQLETAHAANSAQAADSQTLDAQLAACKQQLTDGTAHIAQLQAQLETAQAASSAQAANSQSLQSQLAVCKQQMEEQAAAAAAQLAELRTQVQIAHAANSAQAADSQTLQAQLAACKQQLQEQATAAAAQLAELQTQLETAHAANSAQAADSQTLLAACKQQMEEQAAAAAAQLAELRTQLETAHAANSAQAADSQTLQAQLAACKQQMEEQAAAAAAQLAELQTQLETAHAANSAQAADSQTLDAQLAACKQQMEEQAAAAAAQLAELQTQLGTAYAANSAQAADSQTLDAQLAACKQQLTDGTAHIAQLQAQLETAQAASSAQAADSQTLLAACKQQMEEQAAAAAAQLADLQTQLETAHAANSAQAADSQTLDAQLAACKQQLTDGTAHIAHLQAQLETAQAASSAQAANSQSLQSQLAVCQQQMEHQESAAAQALQSVQAQLEACQQRLQEQSTHAAEQVAQLRALLESAQTTSFAQAAELETLRGRQQELAAQLQQVQQEASASHAQLHDKFAESEHLQSAMQMQMEAMQSQHEEQLTVCRKQWQDQVQDMTTLLQSTVSERDILRSQLHATLNQAQVDLLAAQKTCETEIAAVQLSAESARSQLAAHLLAAVEMQHKHHDEVHHLKQQLVASQRQMDELVQNHMAQLSAFVARTQQDQAELQAKHDAELADMRQEHDTAQQEFQHQLLQVQQQLHSVQTQLIHSQSAVTMEHSEHEGELRFWKARVRRLYKKLGQPVPEDAKDDDVVSAVPSPASSSSSTAAASPAPVAAADTETADPRTVGLSTLAQFGLRLKSTKSIY